MCGCEEALTLPSLFSSSITRPHLALHLKRTPFTAFCCLTCRCPTLYMVPTGPPQGWKLWYTWRRSRWLSWLPLRPGRYVRQARNIDRWFFRPPCFSERLEDSEGYRAGPRGLMWLFSLFWLAQCDAANRLECARPGFFCATVSYERLQEAKGGLVVELLEKLGLQVRCACFHFLACAHAHLSTFNPSREAGSGLTEAESRRCLANRWSLGMSSRVA